MRPISLTLKGINSYASEQSINFEKVSALNLFGVFGETGSGKTTILDAIVMALYGSSERDIIPNVINVNMSDAYIIFEFEITEFDKKIRYRVRRDYKMRPSGLRSHATLEDVETGVMLAEFTDEVNEKILKIIRVAKKEFLKCIALPQGEFDNFLGDTPLNRKRTIAKLFDLEMFGKELNDKLKARRDKVTLHKLNIENKLALYHDASDQNLEDLEKEFERKRQERLDLEFVCNKLEAEFNHQTAQLETKEKLAQLEIDLSLKNKEKKEMDRIENQISYTKNYGGYLEISEKLNTSTEEQKRLENLLIQLKLKLATLDSKLQEKQEDLEVLQKSKGELSYNIQNYYEKVEERKTLDISLKTKQAILDENLEKANLALDEIKELQAQLKFLKNQQEELLLAFNVTAEELNSTIEFSNKLENIKTFSIKEEVVAFFDEITRPTSAHSFDEIEDTKSWRVITKLLGRIQEYKTLLESDIVDIKKDMSDLAKFGADFVTIQNVITNKENDLNKKIDTLKEEIQENKRLTYKTEIAIANALTHNIEIENTIKSAQLDVTLITNQLALLPTGDDLEVLQQKLKNLLLEIGSIETSIKEATTARQQAVIDIEVNSSILENTKKKINEFNQLISAFKVKSSDKETLNDSSLLLTDEELVAMEEVLKNYHSTLSFLEKSIAELKKNFTLVDITQKSLTEHEARMLEMREKAQNLGVEMGILQNIINAQIKNKDLVLALKKEHEVALKKLDTVADLQSLIANGALLEYVSEEYMYLITDFANTYVHSISKGKYFLKYDGDFSVIDNFNGGISRGVKTLSGGERFIISLSLALGISQSIATNNNQNFNFFFIDEGFGALSDGYIEKVLQSFDALIKLDFTVGFITHVERMQNFITNKVIVSKPSNEQGSIITEIY